MWKYLVFNSIWFLILFLSRFHKKIVVRDIVFVSGVGAAIFAVLQGSVDPFSWFYYVIFSWVIFYGAHRFRSWAYAKAMAQDEELKLGSKKLENNKRSLVREEESTEALADRANEIALLYDKVKEMSQSLDLFETFLVFGETLAKFCRFDRMKLAIYNEEQLHARTPEEFYELCSADLVGLIERNVFLKERNKFKMKPFPMDETLLDWVFKNERPLKAFDTGSLAEEGLAFSPETPPLLVYPLVIHKKIFSVLILMNVDKEDLSMLSILTERFISELQRVRLYQKVEMLAITDGLTGVYVRRHLLERLEGEILRCKKFGSKLSFLMIDVDHFKTFNDQYGHLVGDVVLKQVTETIRKSIRELDLAGRYGGEEFGVILVDTDESGAFFVAERICRAVAEKTYRAYDENLKVTVSIGCSTYSEKMHDAHFIVDAADSALYQAKQQGRNKVCVANIADS